MRFLGLALGWGWVAAIAWLSLTASPPKVDVQYSDKLGHFAAYGLLMLWFCFLYASLRARMSYGLGFIAMGIGLEFLQGYLGYRTYEVFDMFANTTGVLLGWGAALILKKPLFR
jgi:VanZ family protein